MIGPYHTICPKPGSPWYGKPTAGIYDRDGVKIAIIPAYPHRTKPNGWLIQWRES